MKAIETGFCKRVSKFSPFMFIDNLLFDAVSENTKSLNAQAINTNGKYNVEISKQGIDQRYTPSGVEFIQALCGKLLKEQFNNSIESGWLSVFKRVLIKDSTKFDVSGNLAKQLPGSGGAASKAGVCIQYEFDLKSGEVNDLSIGSSNCNDTTDTRATIAKVKEGDLIIRDLGYSVLSCFTVINQKKAFYISRLRTSILVYEMKGNEFIELDFCKLHKMMKRLNIIRVEKQVFIGRVEKIPVRLIIELMPEVEVNKRKRNTKANNKKRGHVTSGKFMNRAPFNLYITNIDDTVLAPDVITKIYRLRWQVELIFKTWKSVFGIDNNNSMKYDRLMCLLNVRLLLILINWELFMHKRWQLYETKGKLLSITKCFKTLQEHSKELRHILTNNCHKLINWIEMIAKIFESHHWLEKKKNKIGFVEIMTLNVL
jgi:hypothetical protein